MPRSRIPVFEKRLTQLCEEAGLPVFDDAKYELLNDTLYFLWHDPEFCIAASLARSSPFAMKAGHLLEAWERKFGSLEAA